MDTYKMTIAGVERELKMFPVDENLDIAAFIMFGDVEVTERAAAELLKRCPEHDVVVTAEAKGIPLCYEIARQGCREYVIARKSVKVYMRNCTAVTVNSITTAREQKLYLGDDDVAFLRSLARRASSRKAAPRTGMISFISSPCRCFINK